MTNLAIFVSKVFVRSYPLLYYKNTSNSLTETIIFDIISVALLKWKKDPMISIVWDAKFRYYRPSHSFISVVFHRTRLLIMSDEYGFGLIDHKVLQGQHIITSTSQHCFTPK